ncbi:MAG: DUF1566 domain-containing protein, partial [Candidatus Cloacimonetes bacterium]|nr:DUF1566 domain-containing protein [Candidatus Cloacimonadota bacterium]
IMLTLSSCINQTTKDKDATPLPHQLSSVAINLIHNYYADENTIPIYARLVSINGDNTIVYENTTEVNRLLFSSVHYGSYEITITSPLLNTYFAYINIALPEVNRDIRLSVSGSSGGFVFYDKGCYSEGWRFMEAAPFSAELSAHWGAYRYTIGGTSAAIGTGKQNTEVIVDWLNRRMEYGRAAQVCLAIDGNGEWFLPSREELNLMYINLYKRGVGEFGASDDAYNWWYWSSTEAGLYDTWYQTYYNGFQFYYYKNNPLRVRAARVF